jgi:predicted CoA-binding protein
LSQNAIKEILIKYKTVAVVGLSREPDKDSHRVSVYLKKHGFHIIPLNPFADEFLGEKSYKSLLDVPVEVQETIDVVDIFRPPKDVPLIMEQAVKLKEMYGKPHVVWMQLGIVNEQTAEVAKKAGLTVVMDKCMMQKHSSLFHTEKLHFSYAMPPKSNETRVAMMTMAIVSKNVIFQFTRVLFER